MAALQGAQIGAKFGRMRLAFMLRRRLSVLGLSTLPLLLAAGCKNESTQIVVSVDTDLAIPRELDEIRLDIEAKQGDGFRSVRSVDERLTADARERLPLTLALTREASGVDMVRVTVTALSAGELVLRRQAIARFVTGRVLALPLNLVQACKELFVTCEAREQTCGDDGRCEPITRGALDDWKGPPSFRPGEQHAPQDATLDGGDKNPTDAGVQPDTGVADASDAATSPNDIVDLALGDDHSCALLRSGHVYCWGRDDHTQLGGSRSAACLNEREILCRYPQPVLNVVDAIQITAGAEFSCALLTSHRVVCWGRNDWGQLGRGAFMGSDVTDGEVPSMQVGYPADLVHGIDDAEQVEAGADFACVRGSTGPWCWGHNHFDDLFTSGQEKVELPTKGFMVNGNFAFGAAFGCVIDAGALLCFGDDRYLQWGAARQSDTHTRTVFASGITSAEAGAEHACAIHAGAVECWGRNDLDQLGLGRRDMGQCEVDGSSVACSNPQPLGTVFPAKALALGNRFSCMIVDDADSTVACWGDNENGIIDANDRLPTAERPTRIAGLRKVRLLAAGARHACAVTEENRLFCWGSNAFGQLGAPELNLAQGLFEVTLPN